MRAAGNGSEARGSRGEGNALGLVGEDLEDANDSRLLHECSRLRKLLLSAEAGVGSPFETAGKIEAAPLAIEGWSDSLGAVARLRAKTREGALEKMGVVKEWLDVLASGVLSERVFRSVFDDVEAFLGREARKPEPQ